MQLNVKPIDLGEGILQPDFTQRFLLRFEYIDEGLSTLLSRHVTKAELDYVNNTITVEIEQPILPETHGVIGEMANKDTKPVAISLDSKNGAGHTNYTVRMTHCVCTKHSYKLDYGICEVATHRLTFNFGAFSTIPRTEPDS